MALRPEVLDALVAAGCSAEQIAAAVKADQAKSSGAARQARYRARIKASQSDERDVTCVTVTGSDAVASPNDGKPNLPTVEGNLNPNRTPPISPPAEKPARRARRLPADYWPTPETIAQLRSDIGITDADLHRQIPRAIDWSASAKGGAKTDHEAFIRNWFRNCADRGELSRGPPGASSNVVTLDRFGNPDDDQFGSQNRDYSCGGPIRPGSRSREASAFIEGFCREPQR